MIPLFHEWNRGSELFVERGWEESRFACVYLSACDEGTKVGRARREETNGEKEVRNLFLHAAGVQQSLSYANAHSHSLRFGLRRHQTKIKAQNLWTEIHGIIAFRTACHRTHTKAAPKQAKHAFVICSHRPNCLFASTELESTIWM